MAHVRRTPNASIRRILGVVTLFGYFLAFCSLVLFAAAGWRWWREYEVASHWRRTTGQIKDCSVRTYHPFKSDGAGNVYSLRCQVSYHLDGRSYDSVLNTTSTRSLSTRDQILSWIVLHRPGSELPVRVSPSDGKEFEVEAALPIHQRPTALDGLKGAIPFAIFGAVLAAIGLGLQKKESSDP